MSDERCALWYYTHGSLYFTVHDDEREAAQAANSMEDYGDGSVVGVQFPDGRIIKRDDWEMYEVVWREFIDLAHRPFLHRRQRREIRSPFDPSRSATVLGDVEIPDWVGRPVVTER